ncbi:MAG: helix-turn-helix transcriptional regulator [Prevotella sp.]|nr:helix-turn-helix transcriptional regulator [Prevotella sp.]
MEVSTKIKSFMKDRGLKQIELASELGLPQSTISDMINGRRDTFRLAELIATHYNISRDWLMGGSEILDNFSGSTIELNQEQRQNLLDRLNSLYERHQDIIREEQEIMKQMMAINRMLIVGTKETER